ncbi:hypothetical protein V1477_001245 [Vespula maculifrons]|uniref:Uncharacterized protein n=2 Tax=Vespula TaxID=7451 RepID=A0A834J0B5_VESVU|nr:hypothetical protein HZH66_014851 [Vespula vulgaris]
MEYCIKLSIATEILEQSKFFLPTGLIADRKVNTLSSSSSRRPKNLTPTTVTELLHVLFGHLRITPGEVQPVVRPTCNH